MVLDSGKLAEMESPEVLLATEQGLFKALWERHQASHQAVTSHDDLTVLDSP